MMTTEWDVELFDQLINRTSQHVINVTHVTQHFMAFLSWTDNNPLAADIRWTSDGPGHCHCSYLMTHPTIETREAIIVSLSDILFH